MIGGSIPSTPKMNIREFIRINEVIGLFSKAKKVSTDFSRGQGSSFSLFINSEMYSLKNEEKNEHRRILEKQRFEKS